VRVLQLNRPAHRAGLTRSSNFSTSLTSAIVFSRARGGQSILLRTAKSSLTISAKPAGVGAACQLWIPTGEQSSLLTRIAATERLRQT